MTVLEHIFISCSYKKQFFHGLEVETEFRKGQNKEPEELHDDLSDTSYVTDETQVAINLSLMIRLTLAVEARLSSHHRAVTKQISPFSSCYRTSRRYLFSSDLRQLKALSGVSH